MDTTVIERDQQRRVNKVIDFIFKNIGGNLQLDHLARLANYSPFHFQRIFKRVTAESPKQFIMRVRLEMAFHFLVIQSDKSILEIGINCGFSSPSVFSRAFRNYFSISPDKVRTLPATKKHPALRKLKLTPRRLSKAKNSSKYADVATEQQPEKLNGIYVMAPLNEPKKIRRAFQDLLKIARSNDLDCTPSKLYGILSPRHGHAYMAFLKTDTTQESLPHLNHACILPGKYARLKIKGSSEETMRAMHDLFHSWLPDSGYRIADSVVLYECFSSHPALTDYSHLKRELHVPLQRR